MGYQFTDFNKELAPRLSGAVTQQGRDKFAGGALVPRLGGMLKRGGGSVGTVAGVSPAGAHDDLRGGGLAVNDSSLPVSGASAHDDTGNSYGDFFIRSFLRSNPGNGPLANGIESDTSPAPTLNAVSDEGLDLNDVGGVGNILNHAQQWTRGGQALATSPRGNFASGTRKPAFGSINDQRLPF